MKMFEPYFGIYSRGVTKKALKSSENLALRLYRFLVIHCKGRGCHYLPLWFLRIHPSGSRRSSIKPVQDSLDGNALPGLSTLGGVALLIQPIGDFLQRLAGLVMAANEFDNFTFCGVIEQFTVDRALAKRWRTVTGIATATRFGLPSLFESCPNFVISEMFSAHCQSQFDDLAFQFINL